jgi:hypothetical protein
MSASTNGCGQENTIIVEQILNTESFISISGMEDIDAIEAHEMIDGA